MKRSAVLCGVFWLLSALFLGVGGLVAGPSDDAEAGFVARIGNERAAAGLAGYVVAPDLAGVARRHAEEMRRQQRLHHNPRLGEDVSGWQAVGENVGVGPSVEQIHQKLMASPSHRDNILSGRFTEVGVGVVVDGSELWVVQVFRLPESSGAAPPAEPAESSSGSGSASEPARPASPEPRPAPAPASTPAGAGTVRASASPPVPPTTAATAPTPVVAATGVPASDATAAVSTPGAPSTALNPPGVTMVDTDVRPTGARQVTLPVAVAATMLLGVVLGLLAQVGGTTVRALAPAGQRTSLLDLWELALAR